MGRQCGYRIPAGDVTIKRYAIPYLVYPVLIFMKFVVTTFVLDPQQNKYGSSHADGQSCNIDRGKAFIAQKVPVGDFEEVSNHGMSIIRSVKCNGLDLRELHAKRVPVNHISDLQCDSYTVKTALFVFDTNPVRF